MRFEIIQQLKFDKETGLYSINEAGFKYEFPVSLHDDFKYYIFRHDFVSRWYKHLNNDDIIKVSRTSAYE